MVILCLILYWVSLLALFYTYFGYAALVSVWVKLSGRGKASADEHSLADEQSLAHDHNSLPAVTVLIPAYNEADYIGPKIRNTLELNYPRHLFNVLVITDGSTDGTELIAGAFPQVTVLHQPERRGKAAAINRAMASIRTPVTILTDANTQLPGEAVRLLVRSFGDQSVGAVSGEKKVISSEAEELSGEGEGLYWKYESFLKWGDAQLYSVVGAAGELLAFRSELFQPLEEDTILDDFVLSMRICEQGYRVAYEPAARAVETGSADLQEEQKRKIRIAAGGFQAIGRLKKVWKMNRILIFQYLSHRVFRWVVAPPALILLLFSNLYLVVRDTGWWYELTALGQILFYSMAAIGWLGARTNTKWPIVYLPYYFFFMHWAVLLGLLRYLGGKQDARWEKSGRIKVPVK